LVQKNICGKAFIEIMFISTNLHQY